MRTLDLFSGIGGFALGLESVGFKTIGFCEIEPFPRAVLAHHWPHVPIHDDVRTLSAESVSWLRAEADRGIDVICGGFPCQDISVAGKGAGIEGSRSGLWREFARLVEELRPRWVLAENVGALKQRGIDRVCSDLEGHGYTVWPLLVGAGVGVGAPHRRDRIWIVAHRQGGGQRERGGSCSAGDGGDAHGCGEGLALAASGNGAGRELSLLEGARESRGRGRRRGDEASELSNSDAGRRGGEDDPVQAGRDQPERTDSAVGLADGYEQGQRLKRGGRLLDRERAASRHYADRRGERPVGEPTGSGLEGQRADTGEPQEPEPRDTSALSAELGVAQFGRPQELRRDWNERLQDALRGCGRLRWPARPGQLQHEWEEPRLAFTPVGRRDAQPLRSPGPSTRNGAPDADGPGGPGGEGAGRPELPLDASTDGLPGRLVRLARRANRKALKAVGNAVVPQVVALIGQAILDTERGQ